MRKGGVRSDSIFACADLEGKGLSGRSNIRVPRGVGSCPLIPKKLDVGVVYQPTLAAPTGNKWKKQSCFVPPGARGALKEGASTQ